MVHLLLGILRDYRIAAALRPVKRYGDATGELLISKSAGSEITDRLWEDYQAFMTRDLSEVEVEYLFADAIFESLRRQGRRRRCWPRGAVPQALSRWAAATTSLRRWSTSPDALPRLDDVRGLFTQRRLGTT